jgi:hypothetical protein
MIAQRLLIGTVALALIGGLTACAPEAEPDAVEVTPEPTPTEVESAEPEPELTFTMPTDCTSVLPASRVDALATQNIRLLGGPGSVDGNGYFREPTPEQLAGGISCVFAEDGVGRTTLLISVAPVSTANRATIVNSLMGQGLNEATRDTGELTYSQQGDDNLVPAIYNVVTQQSWVAVISAVGGETFFDEAVTLAGEVSTQTNR